MPFLNDSALDAGLADIATAVTLTYCSAEPANFAGIAAVRLGSYTLTAGVGNGDYTLANGDTSGRKLIVAAQSGGTATGTGTAAAWALDNGTVIKASNTFAVAKAVTTGEAADLSAFDVAELRDGVSE